MTWADFYLICFVVGFAFSLISFLGGGTRHFHLPHLPRGVGHVPVVGHVGRVVGGHVGGVGAGHAPVGGHVPAVSGADATAGPQASHVGSMSPFNFVTLTAFLAWFGGTGYLLTRYSRMWFVVGLGVALVSGLVGAAIVFLFLSRVLTSEEETMDPADYRMVGVLGRTSIPIRAGGTGEIIYSQAGTRRTCGARSEDGMAVAKGVEVVVTRYEKGLAYVRLWTEISGEEPGV